MNSLRYVWANAREFGQRWLQYLLVVGLVGGAVSGIVIPVLRWLTRVVLVAGGVPYLTLTNALDVAVHHPLVAAELLVLGLALLVIFYLQFAIMLGAVAIIRQRQSYHFGQIVAEALRDLRHLRPGSFLFFALYALLIVPLAGFIVGSSLLAKVQVPLFIIDYLMRYPLYSVLVAILYVLMFYLGLRWLLVLPKAILDDMPLVQAAGASWRATKGRFWFYFWRTFWLGNLILVVTYGYGEILVQLQRWLDTQSYAYAAGIVVMSALVLGKLLLSGAGSAMYLIFLTAPDDVHQGVEIFLADRESRLPRVIKVALSLFMLGATAMMLMFSAVYLKGGLDSHPLTISHRGVDAGNGVQNTIPALQKTAKEHPDYVEMDLQETRDHQFVVLHDENLQELAGVNKAPRELTLAQLQQLTVRENGHHAKLASFDAYLAAAARLHQKLIVEIKTTPNDSKGMLQRFIAKYAATLVKHGDRVHSMNYQVVTTLRRQVPDLYTSLILPYALVAPQTDANAYTFEETTLDDTLVDAAHKQHQAIWAWTVNEEDDMQQMLFAGVDGIITDNLHLLKQTIRKYNDNPSYAARMQFFSNTLDDFANNGEID